MMPRKKKNGSRGTSPESEKSLLGGVMGDTVGQYGSESGIWSEIGLSESSHVQKAENEKKFQYLQEAFKGKVEPDVVYMILSESEWKVEIALEKLLELSQPNSAPSRQPSGPSLKTVAQTISSPKVMQPVRTQSMEKPVRDLGLTLRSRLPTAPGPDIGHGGLPMLSPRTPSVAGMDFPVFPERGTADSSIQSALDALDSYGNTASDLSQYVSSFDTLSYGNNMYGMQDNNSRNEDAPNPYSTSDGFRPMDSRPAVTDYQLLPQEGSTGLDRYAHLPNLIDFDSQVTQAITTTSMPYSADNFGAFSQAFQPVRTRSLSPQFPPAMLSGGAREPMSPRTAFNRAVMAENGPLGGFTYPKLPVRENSKESTTSETSLASEVSQASVSDDQSIVDMSPGVLAQRHPKQILRRQNISLDPQERESLEQLIEEVLIGAVDDDDTNESSSESEDDDEGNDEKRMKKSGSKSEEGSKTTPSQLKVAAKHMKNLPPRFLRCLQAAQPGKPGEGKGDGEKLEPESFGEMQYFKDDIRIEEKKKSRKKMRGFLESLAFYDDDIIVNEPELEGGEPGAAVALESPGAGEGATHLEVPMIGSSNGGGASPVLEAPASPKPPLPTRTANPQIILRPNVVNGGNLEQEPPRVPTYMPAHVRQTAMLGVGQALEGGLQWNEESHRGTQFSINAPEFIPRSFHPINPAQQPGVPSPVSHFREASGAAPHQIGGHFSPRSGSPYTVQSTSPYAGRPNSPFHMAMGSLSPQMARRPMAGSPIAMMQVASTGRHSPVPLRPGFFIPKAPPNPAAAVAAGMHIQPGIGVVPFHAFGVPNFGVAQGYRYRVPTQYRPFIPPASSGSPRPNHIQFKQSQKDRLQQSSRPSSAPTVGPVNSRMAANLQPLTVQGGPNKQSAHQRSAQAAWINGGNRGGSSDNSLEKDMKEAKNFAAQGSSSVEICITDDALSPQEKVTRALEKQLTVMIILRGVPGSGKSHLAKELLGDGVSLSTDDFFVNHQVYEYDYGRIGEAHEWNQKRAKEAVAEGKNPVIIDNTNTQAWEMRFYVELALKSGYHVEVIEPDTPWKFRAKELAKRNKHGVSKETIQRMIDRYDHHVTVESIMATSDKQKAEVEHRQKQAMGQSPATSFEAPLIGPDGQPVEEKRTKKKTRRGKGRKKKARLRELREAEAEKEAGENKEKREEQEASSDDESTPERDRGVVGEKKTSDLATPSTAPTAASPATETKKPGGPLKDSSTDTDAETRAATAKSSSSSCEDTSERTEGISSYTPAATSPATDIPLEQGEPKVKAAEDVKTAGTEQDQGKELVGSTSDDSDSGGASLSEPSTAESQLSGESDVEEPPLLGSDIVSASSAARQSQTEEEDARREQAVLQLLTTSVEMSLKPMSITKRGAARQHLKTLSAKYYESAEVRAEIEDIIKEKVLEGMVNKEVAEITRQGRPQGAESQEEPQEGKEKRQARNLTEMDRTSIMDAIDQITQQDDDDDDDEDEDAQNKEETPPEDYLVDLDKEFEEFARSLQVAVDSANEKKQSAKAVSQTEQIYWQTPVQDLDPYKVVGSNSAGVGHRPKLKSQSSWSDSSIEAQWDLQPKPRRERKRPYNKKVGKSSDEFWNMPSESDEGQVEDRSAEASLASSGPTTPGTPSTPEATRDRRSSGRKRLAAQFPLPELDSGVKQQLMMEDWQLPQFSTKELPFSAPPVGPRVATLDVEVYTHPKDFGAVQRILESYVAKEPLDSLLQEKGFLCVRETSLRNIHTVVPDATELLVSKLSVPKKLTVDRSCSTKDLEEASQPGGTAFLQACFPSVGLEDLSDILQQCEGDVQWAVNILLDAGYEYNEPLSPPVPQPVTRTPTSQGSRPSVLTTAPDKDHMQRPVTLAQLCQEGLIASGALNSPEVQERFGKTSVRRLNSIKEYQKTLGTSQDEDVGGRHTSYCSNESTLDLAEDEADGDIFYSPLEGPVSPLSLFVPTRKEHRATPTAAARTAATAEVPITAGQVPDLVQQSSEVPAGEMYDEGTMDLTLSPALAKQLIQLFGPVGFHISADSLSPTDLTVQLSRKTAKQLHRRWALTLQEKFASEEFAVDAMIKNDEALARRLQAEEDQNRSAKSQTRPSPAVLHRQQTNDGTTSLQEIMAEQMALELSKQDYLQLQEKLNLEEDQQQSANTLATKMKRQKLKQMFPTIDETVLEDVYQASGYNLGMSVATVKSSLGETEPTQNVWSPEAIAAYEDVLLKRATEISLQDQWLGVEEGQEEDDYQTLEDPQYQDYRTEASTHYSLRHECFQKAQEAYRRGLKAVATFYSQQGHLHTRKLKDANQRAAEKILEFKNVDVQQTHTIDLHGLHVDEALSVLGSVIAQRERELRKRPDKRRENLYVVTGRGSHSRGGVARIRPAVIDFLKRRQYLFSETIPGMLKVAMRYQSC